MKLDNLKRYIDLRDSLVREKTALQERLAQLNAALAQDEASNQTPQSDSAAQGRPQRAVARRGRTPAGGLSLREAVLRATSQRPMTKEEILEAVKALGYKFSTDNPLNSLGVILYGKRPRFKNDHGRFSSSERSANSGGGALPASKAGTAAGGGKKSGARRQLSPEARERIAAAQRARWAKAKSAK